MGKIDYRELASKLFCFGVLIFAGVLFFRYFFSYSVPFLIAWVIAYAVFPLAQRMSKKTGISRKICSFLMVLALLMIILVLLIVLINRILFEMQNLVAYLSDNSENIAKHFENAFNFFSSLGEKIPILNKLQNSELSQSISENINILINNVWQSLLEWLGSAIPRVAREVVIALPDILLVSLITVISCFYFAVDIEVVNEKTNKIIPKKISTYIGKLKNRVLIGFKKYLKAYFVLFAITFAELLVGLLILRVDYALVLALLIAFVDFLPVFGTGAILVPWGIVALLMKNYFLGLGIIILFVIMTVVRQVIEPKIIGKSLGVHPIISLITVYIGYRLFGIFGMIILPIIVLIFFSNDGRDHSGIY